MIHIRLLPSSITIYRDITEKMMDVDNGFVFIISMKSHLLHSHRFCHHRYRLHRLPQSHRQLCRPGLIFHQRKLITRCYKLFRLVYLYNNSVRITKTKQINFTDVGIPFSISINQNRNFFQKSRNFSRHHPNDTIKMALLQGLSEYPENFGFFLLPNMDYSYKLSVQFIIV